MNASSALDQDGYAVFPVESAVSAWAAAALPLATEVAARDDARRHGGTWSVGVDALPNAPDGSIGGVALTGTWLDHIEPPKVWHRAQVSTVFPGYPQQDADESDAAHTYRIRRDAAHVDGLLPVGPDRRRFLLEPHGFIAGIPLNDVAASPLVVWPESHRIMGRAFAALFEGVGPDGWANVDMTDVYQAARREVFATCARVPVMARPGQVVLLHRHLLHGVAPWKGHAGHVPRVVAYFRPQIAIENWL
ncbi:hypothetical protein [Yoonia sp. 2307UL14-13]|uniref:hypothetical protein n=1 Tax=Yoonia sp. 2307UL14-13 TaxID=3126506 RepID=UPI0030B62039